MVVFIIEVSVAGREDDGTWWWDERNLLNLNININRAPIIHDRITAQGGCLWLQKELIQRTKTNYHHQKEPVVSVQLLWQTMPVFPIQRESIKYRPQYRQMGVCLWALAPQKMSSLPIRKLHWTLFFKDTRRPLNSFQKINRSVLWASVPPHQGCAGIGQLLLKLYRTYAVGLFTARSILIKT